jgi:hypothetical protein
MEFVRGKHGVSTTMASVRTEDHSKDRSHAGHLVVSSSMKATVEALDHLHPAKKANTCPTRAAPTAAGLRSATKHVRSDRFTPPKYPHLLE